MLTLEALHTIDAQLAVLDDAGRDALKAALRIGLKMWRRAEPRSRLEAWGIRRAA